MPRFIKVRTRSGIMWVNGDMIEMIIPRGKECNLRMNEKLFLEVAESVQDILNLLKAASGG